jgi:N-acetylmuramoyl-L-alanine amidase
MMRLLLVIVSALAALLGGCATTTPGGVPIDTRYTSQNQDSRVQFLVIHTSEADLATSLKLLAEPRYEVSAHYLVSDDEKPVIYRLVPEDRRAWHAGPSSWRGHSMLNAASIGIEIVHPGFRLRPDGTRVYLPFPQAQIDALIPLVKDIVMRHGIQPERIVGHSDVAPRRKQDPGPAFPWKRLADEGLIAWPEAQRVAQQRAWFENNLPDIRWFQDMLGKQGYDVPRLGVLDDATRDAIAAFQMRYRPSSFDGTPDAETAAILHVLATPP